MRSSFDREGDWFGWYSLLIRRWRSCILPPILTICSGSILTSLINYHYGFNLSFTTGNRTHRSRSSICIRRYVQFAAHQTQELLVIRVTLPTTLVQAPGPFVDPLAVGVSGLMTSTLSGELVAAPLRSSRFRSCRRLASSSQLPLH